MLDAAESSLRTAGLSEPREEALYLLCWLLDRRRAELLLDRARPVAAGERERFAAWVARRARREPAQRIAGWQEFHGLRLRVDGPVLIPRPETEMLVDAAADYLPQGGVAIDLGSGSGCIAVALAVLRPDATLWGLERSEAALAVARRNAALHRVEDRLKFRAGDFSRPPGAWRGCAHVVVSNPPYVSEAEWSGLAPEVRDHDPREALVPGPTGLEAYGALAGPAAGLLRPGGRLLLELGQGQAEAVGRVVVAAGFAVEVVRPDLAGIPRLLVALLT